jgi:magnesium-transporting ATPase (P-type)
VPPRNIKTDKLTSFTLLFYAYGQAGMILTGGCLFVYFQTFAIYGVTAPAIFQIKNLYFPVATSGTDDAITYYPSNDGRLYSADDQNHILFVVQGGWYLMIVCGQAAHIWVCRTTTVSIFSHGIFTNKITNWGVFIALGLGCFVTYCPGLQTIVQSANPNSLLILYASLFTSFALWSWAEGRKYVTRIYPGKHLFNRFFAW